MERGRGSFPLPLSFHKGLRMKKVAGKLVMTILILITFFIRCPPKSRAQCLALNVILTRTSSYKVTEKNVENGFCQIAVFNLKIVADSNWKLKVDITLLSSPKENNILNPAFVIIKSNNSNEWVSGGGIIQTGEPTRVSFLELI